MHVPMSVVMLGADYAFGPSYMGADLAAIPTVTAAEAQGRDADRMAHWVSYYLNTMGKDGKPMAGDRNQALIYARAAIDKEGAKLSTGESAGAALQNIIKENPNLLSDTSALVLAIQGKSQYSPDDIAKMLAASKSNQGGFSLEANAPWLILGAAAIVAVLLLKKR